MWGTRVPSARRANVPRFIPTYVGNALINDFNENVDPVYPHVCGERPALHPRRRRHGGLSPRMWGTPACQPRHSQATRFIPTYVGNAASDCCHMLTVPVYPHVCGERVLIAVQPFRIAGLSPRMWGTPCRNALGLLVLRFIPTYVGNALRNAFVRSIDSVYPHVCGERSSDRGFFGWRCGLSPRMWGTPYPSLLEYVH